MPRIIFLQPGYAHYREKLFNLLAAKYKIKYIYERPFNVYPGEIKTSNLNCVFLPSGKVKKWLDLLRILVTDNPDIIITSISSSFRTILSYFYCKIYNKKFILWILEWKQPIYKGFNVKSLLGRLRNQLSKKILLDSNALIVGGAAAYNYAISIGKNEDDIFYAFQCADDLLAGEVAIVEKIKNDDKKITFLYLSRIIEWKGLDVLLNAFSKLERDNVNVALIVGGDGKFKPYCVELSKKLAIKNIEFRGAILPDNLLNIYKEADVFVLPSYFLGNYYEAWGLVINEAMGASLPVITTTAVGAAYDLIEDGRNGYIVKENDIEELYKAMSRILNADLKYMGRISRNIFDAKNDFIKMAEGFGDAINYSIK